MVKCEYANRKATCDFLCVGNSNVILSLTVCEIITHELPNVLGKWRSRTLTIWTGERTLSTLHGVQTSALLGRAVRSPYRIVLFVTDVRTNVLPAMITPFSSVGTRCDRARPRARIVLRSFYCSNLTLLLAFITFVHTLLEFASEFASHLFECIFIRKSG